LHVHLLDQATAVGIDLLCANHPGSATTRVGLPRISTAPIGGSAIISTTRDVFIFYLQAELAPDLPSLIRGRASAAGGHHHAIRRGTSKGRRLRRPRRGNDR